jgi:hypothetical protein
MVRTCWLRAELAEFVAWTKIPQKGTEGKSHRTDLALTLLSASVRCNDESCYLECITIRKNRITYYCLDKLGNCLACRWRVQVAGAFSQSDQLLFWNLLTKITKYIEARPDSCMGRKAHRYHKRIRGRRTRTHLTKIPRFALQHGPGLRHVGVEFYFHLTVPDFDPLPSIS